MIKVKGYNFSRNFMGERVPQHVQNIVIKDFCNKNNLNLQLSATEHVMKDSFLIFYELINNINDLHGIVSYSLFLMPEDDDERTKIFKKIIKKRKVIYFAVENMKLENIGDLEKIDNIWKIKKTLPECLNYNE
tara:strand:+ start:423 stop:821 length:399 start_codon:yes stop_codon:yes gene_type:complete